MSAAQSLARSATKKNLPHRQAHDGYGDPVPGLIDPGLRLVGSNLAAPGVAGDGRDFMVLDPVQGFKRKTRRVAARIAVLVSSGELRFHLAGSHNHKISALDPNTVCGGGALEVRACDRITVVERLSLPNSGDIEENPPADHAILRLLDSALIGPGRNHLAAVITIPHKSGSLSNGAGAASLGCSKTSCV